MPSASFQMCANGPILTNGTQCSSCGGRDLQNRTECEQGCDFGSTTGSRPVGWKAMLPPFPPGGSHTISVVSSAGGRAVLRRVTFGKVFLCSGQSNMDLALHCTFTTRSPRHRSPRCPV